MNETNWSAIKLMFTMALACMVNVSVTDAAEGDTLKILNWNVLYGFNHHKSIEGASRWINAQNPNIVAFQELNGISEKSLGDYAKKWRHSYAVTHKEGGFPVGLTSKEPIEVIERKSKGYHHGFLHCKTYGIHFFVVHFWPGKPKEVDEILSRIAPLLEQKERVVILGDFNGCSRKDEAFLIANAKLRKRDYTFVDKVEAKGFVDIVHKHDPKAKISCPSPITIPRWSKDMEELKQKRYRIDFVFADRILARDSRSGTISLAREIDTISDHYPVIIELDISKHNKTDAGDGLWPRLIRDRSTKKAKECIMKTIPSVLHITTLATTAVAETPETALLKKRTEEFRKDIVLVADNVYTFTGHSVQPVSMIVRKDGLIIVDTGLDTISAKSVLAEMRKITPLPIKAIILTHGHGDHTGGVPIFAAEGSPDIWARGNFNDEGHAFASAGLTINTKRGARQGGFMLPPEKRINNGVARAYYPKRGGAVFGAKGSLKPNRRLTVDRKTIEYAGIQLDLVSLNGETKDALYVWYADERVLFAGDNFYKSWPNLYPIRGAAYRNVQAWAESVNKMLQENPDKLVPGHTRPVTDKAMVIEMLTNYRDAIRFVFDKTIEGMNKGMTPDELVDYVKLPQKYSEKDYLKEYYGNIEWAVRSIFAGTLGWFDGNPTTLFSLPPAEEAAKMADLAGGADALAAQARKALANGEAQWCAQLCDHLIALNPDSKNAKLLKADALEKLAEDLITATGRNYYLTVAQELRSEAKK